MRQLTKLWVVLLPVLPIIIAAFPWPGASRSYDIARYLQLMLLLLLATSWKSHFWNLLSTRQKQLVVALASLSIASCVFAAKPDIAFREVGLILSLLLAMAVVSSSLDDDGTLRKIVRLFIGGQAFYVALILILLISGQIFGGVLDYWKIFAGFSNPRYFNHAQTLIIPLLAGAIGMKSLQDRWRWVSYFALAAHFALLMLLLGRGTAVALLIIGMAAAIFLGKQGRSFALTLVIGTLLGATLYFCFAQALPHLLGFEAIPAFRDVGERNSVEARFYLWQIAWTDIVNHPWLGIGPMHYAHHFNGEAAHPHNVYLQVAAEFGLPFAALVLLALAWALKTTFLRIRKQGGDLQDPLAVAAFAACVAALIDGLFSGNFVMPISQIWVVFAVSLLISRLSKTDPDVVEHPSAWQRGFLVFVIAAQVVGLAIASQEFWLDSPNLVAGQLNPGEFFSPRFWQDGWF